jgi:hypothetical protein
MVSAAKATPAKETVKKRDKTATIIMLLVPLVM